MLHEQVYSEMNFQSVFETSLEMDMCGQKIK